MDNTNTTQQVMEFFVRRFPEKNLITEKKCGYFDEWVTRFENDVFAYADFESTAVLKEMGFRPHSNSRDQNSSTNLDCVHYQLKEDIL